MMDQYARPQQLVPVTRRRRLNILAMGEGRPTVVLAAGYLGGTLDWGLVQPHVARFARVVSFDPPGLGFSDPAPGARTSTAIVRDLRAALAAAGIPPPYVLVGHSAGALRMHLFAANHPEEVAGLVMVDGVTADCVRRLPGTSRVMAEDRAVFRRMLRKARAGILTPDDTDYIERIGLPRAGLSPAVNQALHEMWTRPSYLSTAIREGLAIAAPTAEELAADRRSLGDLPLVVLSAGSGAHEAFIDSEAEADAWTAMHDEIAALSSRGVRRTVPCGHNIPVEQPRAVVEAIEHVLAAVRPGSEARGSH
ncbi:alpha/beta hydrolase [uncultured Phenylobacterium sp.]|uniref:alpha/beta fold hydrolase n=1 Tax=uncultured Phenylobacterium sp. TaxID=349273 RepID=UPI0025FB3846|nr:alpha/beta hydrolase [uncultured Phenylobacterium sp.]